MKKSCLLLITGLCAVQLTNAQTLTMQYNEPVAGDIHSIVGCDSNAVIPKNTGLNQQWDFSSVTENTVGVISTTFVAAASVTASSQFPGATLAENTGSDYNFYKSAAGQFEMIGFELAGPPLSAVNFTNSMVINAWPTFYNVTFNDTYSGMSTGGVLTTIRKIISVFSAPFAATFTGSTIQYDYYSPVNKFPLVTVVYSADNNGSSINKTADISINKIIGCATPTLGIAQSSSVLCAGGTATLTASGADNYSWNNFMTNGAQQVITPTITTTYTVTGYNTNCTQTQTLTVTQQVAVCTGLNDEALSGSQLTCYPNPFEDFVSIENTSSARASATIVDISGKGVLQVFIESGETKHIETGSLDKGIYFINIANSHGQVNKKLVKK